MDHPNSQIMSLVITVIVVGLVLALRWRRIGQLRPLKLEQLYVLPAIYAAVVAITLVERPPMGSDWLWCAIGVIAGAAIGWYRGKAIRISVDPTTHSLNQTASPATFLFIAALVIIRVGLRSLVTAEASAWHISAVVVIDALSWGEADDGLIERWNALPEWPPMLLRALMFRLAVHALHPRSTAEAFPGLARTAALVRLVL